MHAYGLNVSTNFQFLLFDNNNKGFDQLRLR